jgi:transcriptional regulator with XRE-family HTH domain
LNAFLKEVRKLDDFGAWVREERLARKMRQAECARRAGIAPQRWNHIEKHVERAEMVTLQAVSRGLEMGMDAILARFHPEVAASVPIGTELEALSLQLPPDKRPLFWRIVRQHAELTHSALLADLGRGGAGHALDEALAA